MAGEVGALRVVLGANTAQFEQGMRRAAATAQRTGQDIERSYLRLSATGVRAFSSLRIGMAGLGAALAGNFLFQQARGAVEWAASLGETAQQIGVTVEQLQVLRLAADQNGASVEGMERAVAILNRTLGQARAGLPAAVQAFRAIGISREQLQSFQSAGEAFPVIAERISHLATSAEQAAAAQRLFGRGAAELLPILAQGRAGYDAATQAAIRNGLVTEEQARKADEASDTFAAFGATLRVDLVNAVSSALPALVSLGRIFTTILGTVIRVVGWVFGLIGALARLASQTFVLGALNGLTANRPGLAAGVGAGAGARMGGAGGPGGFGAAPGGADLDLAPSGGGGGRPRARAGHAARDAHQFDTDERRLQMDILRAQMEQTQALDERNEIQGRIADLEAEQWRADLAYRQSQGEINAAQAEILSRKHDQLVLAETVNRAQEYNYRVAQQENELADQQQSFAEARARYESDMAETMAERRRLELDLLRITMENRRRALQAQIEQAQAHSDPYGAAKAQQELDNLPNLQRQEQGRIMRDTRGPLESYLSGLPRTAAQAREALQGVAVDGLRAIENGFVDLVTGTENWGKVFKRVANQIIADLVRIQIQQLLVRALGGIFGGVLGGGGLGNLGGLANAITSGATSGASFGGAASIFGGARAAGGPVIPGRTYLVGEKGPELLHMAGDGYITPNHAIGTGMGGRVIIELRDEMLTARISEGSQIEIAQAYPGIKHGIVSSISQANRRRG